MKLINSWGFIIECDSRKEVESDSVGIYTREGMLDTSGGMDSGGSSNSAMYDSGGTPPNMKSLNGGPSPPNMAADDVTVANQSGGAVNGAAGAMNMNGDGSSYDCQSSSVIKLTNGSVMVLKEVNKYLALVFIIRDDHYKVSAVHAFHMAHFQESEKVFD